MQYKLELCALQRHFQKTMRHVVISAAVDRHLSQSEDVNFIDYIIKDLSTLKSDIYICLLSGLIWFQTDCKEIGRQHLYVKS